MAVTTINGNNYYLNLNSPVGVRLAVIDDFFSLDYARSVNNVGQLQLIVPVENYLPLISEYCQLEVWRTAGSGVSSPYLDMETLWIIVAYRVVLGANGELQLEITAKDAMLLLESRCVAYFTASSQTVKSGLAGNLMKAVVRENVASTANDYTGTATTRGLSSSLFTVQADLGDGASIDMQFAWRNVLSVLQDMANASMTAGTYLAFDVVYDGFGHLEFRTYAGQRGADHRFTSNNWIILDPYAGNLADTSLSYDYTDEATFIYCAGQREQADRVVATSSNATRMAVSPFSRRELFQDARQSDTSAQVQDQADAALWDGRGKVVFDGKVIETPYTRYGIEYKLGDILPGPFLNRTVDCRLDKVHVSVANALETIDVRLQSVT
jgi:hypothetical protein